MADDLEPNSVGSPIQVRTIHCRELHFIRLRLIPSLIYIGVFISAYVLADLLSTILVIPSQLVFFGIIGLALLAVFVVHLRVATPWAVRRLGEQLAHRPDTSPRELLDHLIKRERRSEDTTILPIALKLLVERGHVSQAFRLWKHKPAPAVVEPLTHPFEPRLIDETDVGFVALAHATEKALSDASEVGSSADDDIRRIPRFMRRNILLNGGYLFLLVALLWIVRDTILLIRTGEFSFRLLFSCIALAALLWLPVSGGAISREQWLVLPGGLLRRTPTKRSNESDLYIFNARRSLLLAIQTPYKAWRLLLSDGEESDWFDATKVEMDIICRAWCSPIKPPTVEQLSDFK